MWASPPDWYWCGPRPHTDTDVGLAPKLILVWASPPSWYWCGPHPKTDTDDVGLAPILTLMWASPSDWNWFISKTDDIVLFLFLIGWPFATFSFSSFKPVNTNQNKHKKECKICYVYACMHKWVSYSAGLDLPPVLQLIAQSSLWSHGSISCYSSYSRGGRLVAPSLDFRCLHLVKMNYMAGPSISSYYITCYEIVPIVIHINVLKECPVMKPENIQNTQCNLNLSFWINDLCPTQSVCVRRFFDNLILR